MVVELGILYSDQEQVWKPVLDAALFRQTGVLTLSFTWERGNRSAFIGRMFSRQNNERHTPQNKPWWGDDSYGIGIMPNGDYMTKQWSDDDEFLILRSAEDGHITGRVQVPSLFPAEATVTVFEGAYLDPPEWEKALAVYVAEMR